MYVSRLFRLYSYICISYQGIAAYTSLSDTRYPLKFLQASASYLTSVFLFNPVLRLFLIFKCLFFKSKYSFLPSSCSAKSFGRCRNFYVMADINLPLLWLSCLSSSKAANFVHYFGNMLPKRARNKCAISVRWFSVREFLA